MFHIINELSKIDFCSFVGDSCFLLIDGLYDGILNFFLLGAAERDVLAGGRSIVGLDFIIGLNAFALFTNMCISHNFITQRNSIINA